MFSYGAELYTTSFKTPRKLIRHLKSYTSNFAPTISEINGRVGHFLVLLSRLDSQVLIFVSQALVGLESYGVSNWMRPVYPGDDERAASKDENDDYEEKRKQPIYGMIASRSKKTINKMSKEPMTKGMDMALKVAESDEEKEEQYCRSPSIRNIRRSRRQGFPDP